MCLLLAYTYFSPRPKGSPYYGDGPLSDALTARVPVDLSPTRAKINPFLDHSFGRRCNLKKSPQNVERPLSSSGHAEQAVRLVQVEAAEVVKLLRVCGRSLLFLGGGVGGGGSVLRRATSPSKALSTVH